MTYIPGFNNVLPDTADGSVQDWDTSSPGIPMFNAGKPDKPHVADAFLSYRCSDNTLCVLVVAKPGIAFTNSEAWMKIYTSESERPFSGFQFISSGGMIIAWEACLAESFDSAFTGTAMEIHANWGEAGSGSFGNTASTGKKNSLNVVCLELDCGCDVVSDCTGTNQCTQATCDNGVCEYTAN